MQPETSAVESAHLPAGGLLTAGEVAGLLRVSRRTLYRLRARGGMPAPVEVSTGVVRWRAADVRAFIDSLRARPPRRRPEHPGVEPQAGN